MSTTSSAVRSMTAEEIRATMRTLLQEPDGVFCAAVDENAVLVPMPDGVTCASPVPFVTDRVLDLFVAPDWTELAESWLTAKTDGAAALTVHLAARPDEDVAMFLGDFREEHGVMLAVLRVPHLSVEDLDAMAPAPKPRMCVLRHDPNLVIVDVDAATTAMLGWERHELIGRRGNETVHPADLALMHQGHISASRDAEPKRVRVRRRRKDGTWLWVESTVAVHLDDADPHILVVLFDISEEMAAIAALQEREMLLSSLTQALPEGLLQIDRERRVVFTNSQLHAILGTPADADLPTVLAAVADGDRPALEAAVTAVATRGANQDLEVDLGDAVPLAVAGRRAACRRRCQVHVRALYGSGEGVSGVLVCISDVTEAAQLRRELEARARELEDRATYDALTRCYNRASVMAILDRALERRGAAATTVIFVDIDGFKPINDRFGHAAGDELLVTVAHRLRSALRGDDVVGRIGGDEFLVVCHDVRDHQDATSVGERIQRALAEDVTIAGHTVAVRSSIGVAMSGATTGPGELVRRADLAMYLSKRRGAGDPVLYQESLEMVAGPPGPGLPRSVAG